MATFRHRCGKWQAQICMRGVRKSKTFDAKSDAKSWAAREEMRIAGTPEKLSAAIPLRELVESFCADYGENRESAKLVRFLLKSPLANLPLTQITEKLFCQYAENIRLQISPNSFIRYAGAWSVLFGYGVKRGLMISNPAKAIAKPRPAPHRERIASHDEIAAIMQAADWIEELPPRTVAQKTAAAFLLSCLTGMRGGEILQIRQEWIRGNVIFLPASATKTRVARQIAISDRAVRILKLVAAEGATPIFDLSARAKQESFGRLRDKAGLGILRDGAGNIIREALHFHDGRATFATWAATHGIDVLALARQLGHTDLKMTQRYYRPSAQELAQKINGLDDF